MMRKLQIGAAASVLAACGAPDAAEAPSSTAPQAETAAPVLAAPQAERTKPVVVMLGDSLTAGFGLPVEQALPEQVARELSAAGINAEIVNAGVSGDTTANALARYDWSVASAAPDLLVIALGANDYLSNVSPDVARANLEAILSRARTDGVAVALAGLQPRSDAPAGSRDAAYADIYPALAAAYDVPLYPALLAGVRDNPDLLQRDGLHPTAEGVGVMAAGLAAFITPLMPPADD
ncbi:MAG: arylesterase [Pseudomonadota bacterium]